MWWHNGVAGSRLRRGAIVRAVAALAIAALVGGCFQPVYGDRSPTGGPVLRDQLSAVDVLQIEAPKGTDEARLAVEIRNALLFDFTGGGSPASPTHKLKISMTSQRTSIIVDINTSRPDVENYGINASYSLTELATNRVVVTGQTFARVSYDIPGQQQRFARLRGLRDAESRAAKVIADNIMSRLSSYFVAGRRASGAVRALSIRHARATHASIFFAMVGSTASAGVAADGRAESLGDREVSRAARSGAADRLVFGPDAGLVRERAEALVRASIDDPKDPFQLARLDGDDLASEPTRLVEEANTIPLFGGRRAVWVKAGSRNFAPAVEALVAAASPDCRVVIEAGDLAHRTLRRSASAPRMSWRCRATPTPKEIWCASSTTSCGRQASPSHPRRARAGAFARRRPPRLAHEIAKLALFARGQEQVELDDVMAVVADASTLALDGLIDAAFAGRTNELEVQFGKARTAGTSPGTIVSTALRQVTQLHKARLAVDDGASVSEATGVIQPFVHFSRKAAVEAALRSWTSARLERAMAQLAEALLESRKQAGLADVIAQRTLLSLAVNVRRKG
jgi:DNA polymerase-3 subunit delta